MSFMFNIAYLLLSFLAFLTYQVKSILFISIAATQANYDTELRYIL